MERQRLGFLSLLLLSTWLLAACAGPARTSKGIAPGLPDKFVHLKLDPACAADDPVIARVQEELKKRGTVLALMESWLEELKRHPDTGSPQFQGLERLFACGIAPESMNGHFYGLTLFLKKGETQGGEFLNQLWGYTLGPVSPWDGKILELATADDLKIYTQGMVTGKNPTFMGINCFKEYPTSPLNMLSVSVLDFWLQLKPAPPEGKKRYGYEKEGGLFVARSSFSVLPGEQEKKIFQLNYRWRQLKNPLPVCYLVDEMVEIADGLYLGRLVYATRNLGSPYDPAKPASFYGYQNYGYFLLMDDDWHGISSDSSPGKTTARGISNKKDLKRFTFLESCGDDPQVARIKAELARHGTVLDLMKFYSIELSKDPGTKSPWFDKLQKIFSCGKTPDGMSGYLHGAVVAFKNEGFLNVFNINTLNMKWPLARLFSPWTGKTFTPIHPDKLRVITGNRKTDTGSVLWGANTYSTRSLSAKISVDTMRSLGITIEKASPEEIRDHDYNEKGFFFIASRVRSVNPVNHGRTVLQFNYRWPALKTFPPDNYCMDEVVEIARNLYLGQLNYATNIAMPYDPDLDPGLYRYKNFGFFLLMGDEWQKRRLEISFDIPGRQKDWINPL